MIVQGQKILTHMGLKYVHQVEIDDLVIGEQGTWIPVTGITKQKMKPNSSHPKHRIKVLEIDGEFETIQITMENVVLRKTTNGVEHVVSEAIQVGDYLASPRMQSSGTKGENISTDIAWFLGMYCAKGQIQKDSVRFLLPSNTQHDWIKRLCTLAGSLGAKKANAEYNQVFEKFVIDIEGESIVALLQDLFHPIGYISPHKIPFEFHDWNKDNKTNFLLGNLNGHCDRIKGGAQSWYCVSPTMSYNLCFIASALGISVEHTNDLWDYSGVIDTKKELVRDDKYIYRKVIRADIETVSVDKIGYQLYADDGGVAYCVGTTLVG